MSGEEKLPYALGGIVVAGLLYLALAGLIKAVGVRKVMRFLPPVVTGPIIILIGLSLAPSAINNASTNWWIGAITRTAVTSNLASTKGWMPTALVAATPEKSTCLVTRATA